MSPWWNITGASDKTLFETSSEFCSSSDMDSEVPSIQLFSSVVSPASNSFYSDSDILKNSDDDNDITSTCDRSSWSLVTKHTVKGCL